MFVSGSSWNIHSGGNISILRNLYNRSFLNASVAGVLAGKGTVRTSALEEFTIETKLIKKIVEFSLAISKTIVFFFKFQYMYNFHIEQGFCFSNLLFRMFIVQHYKWRLRAIIWTWQDLLSSSSTCPNSQLHTGEPSDGRHSCSQNASEHGRRVS